MVANCLLVLGKIQMSVPEILINIIALASAHLIRNVLNQYFRLPKLMSQKADNKLQIAPK